MGLRGEENRQSEEPEANEKMILVLIISGDEYLRILSKQRKLLFICQGLQIISRKYICPKIEETYLRMSTY